MKKFKKDSLKITFRVGEKLRNQFKRKCFMGGVSQKEVLINLISKWLKGKV